MRLAKCFCMMYVFEIKNLDLVHENFKIEGFVGSTLVWVKTSFCEIRRFRSLYQKDFV